MGGGRLLKGRPVFTWDLIEQVREVSAIEALAPGKHTLELDCKCDDPGQPNRSPHFPFSIAAISFSCPKERVRSRPRQELSLCLSRTESFRLPMESTEAWVEATAWADAQVISPPGFFLERHADARTVIPKSTTTGRIAPDGSTPRPD
jgi:hypothetical protein